MSKKITDINDIARVCSTCGNCLHACPVYNAQLIEPNSPRGKINLVKALMDGRLEPGKLNTDFMYHCVLCGSCENICPNGVEFTNMMVTYRNKLSEGKKIPLVKKGILYLYQSIIFKKFVWAVDIIAKTPLRQKLGVPRRLKTSKRKLFAPKGEGKKHDILLFPGCVLTYFYPQVTEKILTFLRGKGFSVVLPKNLQCCGSPYMTQGWQKEFDKLKKKNSRIFDAYDFKYLVVPCGTGVKAFRNYYELKGVEILDLTEFIFRFIPHAKLREDALTGREGKITYHDPCHALKSLKIDKEPRHFMKQLGDKFVDDKSALCCGFGGIFSVGFPSTSKKILNRKEDKLNEIGAETVVTSCPGCFMQLREKLPQDVKFFIDLFE